MDDFWKIVCGVLLANIITAWFLYGMVKATKIFDGDRIPGHVFGALVIPLGLALFGLYLYG